GGCRAVVTRHHLGAAPGRPPHRGGDRDRRHCGDDGHEEQRHDDEHDRGHFPPLAPQRTMATMTTASTAATAAAILTGLHGRCPWTSPVMPLIITWNGLSWNTTVRSQIGSSR